ncbi:DUF86 domain-containing protein [Leptolyngbya sp. DQ-M1]|uniref:HepT-like ribonuclease domain-containing protein n=1 Tax=Leptolyngbya sp. DQ-M1 TaxID=2933920 RepID=UPI0032997A0E
MSRDQEAPIDITEAIKLIFQYSADVSPEALAANLEKQDAILRRITIIGEATKRLSQKFRTQHPSIPWKAMAGMRDVITHDYNEVDLDEVWTVIHENLPLLLEYIEPLLPLEE